MRKAELEVQFLWVNARALCPVARLLGARPIVNVQVGGSKMSRDQEQRISPRPTVSGENDVRLCLTLSAVPQVGRMAQRRPIQRAEM